MTSCGTGYEWNGTINKGRSSTSGNIYGIYDMSGGTWEYVMGNVATGTSTYTYQIGASELSSPNEKYYDSYTNSLNSNNGNSHANGKLGDATKETLKSFGSQAGGWFGNYMLFPDGNNVWFERGGSFYNGSRAGSFYVARETGRANNSDSFRVVLSHE